MDEQRLQDYLNLIQELLACSGGEELEILQRHQNLVDEELVMVMEQVATDMAEEENQNAANIAIQLAESIAEQRILKLNELAVELHQRGEYPQGLIFASQALALAQHVWGDEHPHVASSLSNLAVLYQNLGRYKEAESLYEKALELELRLWGDEDSDVVTTLSNLAGLYRSQGRYDKAEPLYKQALTLRQRLWGDKHPHVASSLNNLASLYHDQGRYSDAESLYEQALHLWLDLGADEHPDLARSLNNLANLYQDQGRYSKAEPLFKQALNLYRRLFGDEHPDLATLVNNLARLYEAQGRYSEAESLYEQALDISLSLLGDKHPAVATSLNNLALLYEAQGRYSKAEHFYKHALAIGQHLWGHEHPHVATSLNNLALLYRSQGHYNKAKSLFMQALALMQRLLGNQHPDVANTLNNLAGLYHDQGCYTEAEPLYKQSLELTRCLEGDEHPHLAQSLNNLAGLLTATNRPTEALAHRLQATQIENRLISQVFATSSENDRLAYLQTIRSSLDGFVSLVWGYLCDSAEAVQAALDLVLKRKSLTAAALAAQNQALYSGRYPHLKRELEQLRSLSDQIVHLSFSPPEPDNRTTYQQHLAQLEAKYHDLQRKLASQVPEIQLSEQPVDRHAIALELSEGNTLVEFVLFHAFDFKAVPAREESPWQPARYLAFVLPAKQPDQVQMIDLGEAEPIDRLIQVFRQSISLEGNNLENRLDMGGDDDDSQFLQYNPAIGIELRQVLFDPIRPYLSESKHLLLSPDGGLNLVPFQILPIDETGRRPDVAFSPRLRWR
jgi:tetratricopeptide (TPR) repeat protein